MTTAEKQNYLYKEIIESDLDPEEFQLFLESKKPENGLDITLWKFDDLKQVLMAINEGGSRV
jgi:gentisate 1,2-dioxygenase